MGALPLQDVIRRHAESGESLFFIEEVEGVPADPASDETWAWLEPQLEHLKGDGVIASYDRLCQSTKPRHLLTEDDRARADPDYALVPNGGLAVTLPEQKRRPR